MSGFPIGNHQIHQFMQCTMASAHFTMHHLLNISYEITVQRNAIKYRTRFNHCHRFLASMWHSWNNWLNVWCHICSTQYCTMVERTWTEMLYVACSLTWFIYSSCILVFTMARPRGKLLLQRAEKSMWEKKRRALIFSLIRQRLCF